MKTLLRLLSLHLVIPLLSATVTYGQEHPGSPPSVPGSQGRREPARVWTTVPSARPILPRRARPTPNYGAMVTNMNFRYSLWLLGQERLKMTEALRAYAATIPAGKRVEVRAIYGGRRFRRLHISAADSPWDAVFLGRNEHSELGTVRGTNIQMAEDLGYHCAGPFGCFPPAEWDTLMGVCSVPGRDPAEIHNPCISPNVGHGDEQEQIRTATQAGVGEAWLSSVSELVDTVGAATNHLVQGRHRATLLASQEQIHAATMRGYRETVYLARTFVAFSDPELSRQIDAVGTSALSVYDALHMFRHLPPGASSNLAAIALTGNLVGAGFTLAAAFADSGPSTDQILSEQIRTLRRDVQELRKEMHERFDAVHDHLDSVYASMIDGFDVLLAGNSQSFRSILAQLDDGRRRMTELGRVQLDTQAIVLQQSEFLTQLITDLQFADAGCERPLPAAARDTFSKCRDKIAALHGSLRQRQLPLPKATTTMDAWLKGRPDRTMSWDFLRFKRLLAATGPRGATRALAMPDSVVGPEAWFGIMDLHDGFLMKYPSFAADDLNFIRTSSFSLSMALYRSDLVRFAEAIRDELRTFQQGSRPSVFSELFDEAWNRDRFVALLRTIGDPFRLARNCMDPNMGTQTHCEALASLHSSSYVRGRLLAMDEFRAIEDAMSIAGSHLQHWTALALRNQIGRSEAVTSIAAGWVAVPNLRATVEASDLGFVSWLRLVEDVEEALERVKGVLRSDDLRAAIAEPFHHDLLTGFDFPSLGDVELQNACCR